MAEVKSKSQNENRDGLALIIGGLLVLAIVFGAYSYFNRSTPQTPEGVTDSESTVDEPAETEAPGLGDRIKNFLGVGEETTTTDTTESDLNGKGVTTRSDKEKGTTETATGTGGPIVWIANDYSRGDISGTNYTVKAGDTLWEIAEARYGNGVDWTRILDANSANIGFLPNGQQALIVVGQTLVLPN